MKIYEVIQTMDVQSKQKGVVTGAAFGADTMDQETTGSGSQTGTPRCYYNLQALCFTFYYINLSDSNVFKSMDMFFIMYLRNK